MRIKLFVKEDCPRCPAAKRAVEGLEPVDIYDVEGLDGLTEASYYNIMSTPSILVVDSAGVEVDGWRGEVPDPARLRGLMAN